MVGVIENVIKNLTPIESVFKTSLSSRTDAGVHAVSNTMHLDLKLKKEFIQHADDDAFTKSYFKEAANESFIQNNYPIRSD